MKALKCKPSAQFAYNYSINVLSKCSNIISHRSSIFEGQHIHHRSLKLGTSIFESRHIDLQRLTHRPSIFEGRHIDLQRSKAETSHRQFITKYCPQRRFVVLYLKDSVWHNIRRSDTRPIRIYGNSNNVCDPGRALVMYYMPIYIAHMC